MLADIIDVTTLWGRDGKLSGQELPFRMSSFVGKLFKNILIVVTSAIPNSSLSTAQMCLQSAISFHFFFTHSSILQLFSLPRRKQMYNFQCSAAYQMDVTSWLPHSLYDTQTYSSFRKCECAPSLLGSQLRLGLFGHAKVAGWASWLRTDLKAQPFGCKIW